MVLPLVRQLHIRSPSPILVKKQGFSVDTARDGGEANES